VARRRISRRTATIVVIVVTALIVGPSIYWYEYMPGGAQNPFNVNVGEVIWTLNGAALATTAGFSVHAGKSVTISVPEYCGSGFFGPNTCSSGSVYVLTAGFGVGSTNTPFTWSSGSNGASSTVLVVLTTPNQEFNGNVYIDLH
jgi:hypothetical protein